MAIFKLWILHLLSATILQTFENGLPKSGWFVIGLIFIALIGTIHGLIGGYFITKAIKRKGLSINRNATLTEQ